MPASLRLLLLGMAIVAAPEAMADEFQPHFDRATLKIGQETYPRVRVDSPWYPGMPHWRFEVPRPMAKR